MNSDLQQVKTQILAALEHPEASDGLYFRNFYHLDDEDERPVVEADEASIFDALAELIAEGRVTVGEHAQEVTFHKPD